MANLVRFLVDLVEDDPARASFLAAPQDAVRWLGEGLVGGLTGEDVTAAVAVVRHRLPEELQELLTSTDRIAVAATADPEVSALNQLQWWCDIWEDESVTTPPVVTPDPEIETIAPVDDDDDDEPRDLSVVAVGGGEALPDHPPGEQARLWAVGDGDGEAIDGQGVDGASTSRPRLAPVPEPDGGYEASVLELVELPDGHAGSGVAPGTQGTVVAVHREPALMYELEIVDDEGQRLVVVPHDAVSRVVG